MTQKKMDLSLLPSQAKFQIEKMKWVRWNRMIIGIIGCLWIMIVLVVVGMNVVGGWRLTAAEKAQAAASKNLAGMADGVINSQRLKYNAKLVGEVLSQRFEYGKAFKTIATIFPPEVYLDKIDLKDSGKFEIGGQTSGDKMLEVEQIMENINSDRDERFSSLNLKTLSLKSNIWIFAGEVVLK